MTLVNQNTPVLEEVVMRLNRNLLFWISFPIFLLNFQFSLLNVSHELNVRQMWVVRLKNCLWTISLIIHWFYTTNVHISCSVKNRCYMMHSYWSDHFDCIQTYLRGSWTSTFLTQSLPCFRVSSATYIGHVWIIKKYQGIFIVNRVVILITITNT